MLFIIEGIDGSGKSTLIENLKLYFNDESHYAFFYEPTHQSVWGKKIRQLLKKKTSLSKLKNREILELYRKDRYWDIQNNIQPALGKNKITFLDRYYFSTAAYQGQSIQDIAYILQSNRDDTMILQPDAIFYLDIEPTLALARIHTRTKKLEVFEKKHNLERIYKNYSHILSEHSFHFPIFNLDASLSADLVLQNFLNYYVKIELRKKGCLS